MTFDAQRQRAQLVSTSAPTERHAAAALATPDADGRLPVVVRVGRPSLVRWVPIAVAMGVVGFVLILSPPPIFVVALFVAAAAFFILSLLGRLFIHVPEGASGLVSRRNRQDRTFLPGNYVVPPGLALTHFVTRREFVFDAPATHTRSAEGVPVDLDLLVTLRIVDAARFVFQISVGDFDTFTQAAIRETVRSFIRGMTAFEVLDVGPEHAIRLKAALGKLTGPFGVEVTAIAFTGVSVPSDVSESFEESRLAPVRHAEEQDTPAAPEYELQPARLRVARKLPASPPTTPVPKKPRSSGA